MAEFRYQSQPAGTKTSSASRVRRVMRGEILLYAIAFGLATAQHALNTDESTTPFLRECCSFSLLYLVAIICPRRFGILAVLVFLVASFIDGGSVQVFENLRGAAFSFILSFGANLKLPLPPFLVLFTSWVALILADTFSLLINGPRLIEFGPSLVLSVIAEMGQVLLWGMLRYNQRLNSFVTHGEREFPTQVVLIELFSVPVLVATTTVAYIIFSASGETASFVLSQFQYYQLELLVAFSVIIGFPVVWALTISRRVVRTMKQLRVIATPSNRLLQEQWHKLPLRELIDLFNQVRGFSDKLDKDIRDWQAQVKELRIETNTRAETIRELELERTEHRRLINLAPFGILQCTGVGVITGINEKTCEVLELKREELLHKNITSHESHHPWVKELGTLFSVACRNLKKLANEGPIKLYSTSHRGHYLEMLLEVSGADTPNDLGRGTGVILTTEAAVTIFLQVIADRRGFQLSLLKPSPLEVVGSRSLEITGTVRSELELIEKHLSMKTEELENPLEMLRDPARAQEVLFETALLLKNVERTVYRSRDQLEKFISTSGLRETEKKEINFSAVLTEAIGYLAELVSLEEPLQLDHLDEQGSTIVGKIPDDKFIRITGIPTEVTRFTAYYSALLRGILLKTTKVTINIGYEEIGAGTAAIIPGSHPGRFVRLVLTHPGQSVTTALVPDSLEGLQDLLFGHTALEAAIVFLTIQSRRLGGFLTVQSSGTKGTEITVYLPVDPWAIDERALSPTAQTPANINLEEALIIGNNNQEIETITALLNELGVKTQTENAEEVVEEILKREKNDFGGAGFGEIENEKATSAEEIRREEFDLLVITIEKVNAQALYLIQQLQRAYPNAGALLVTDPSSEGQQLIAPWPKVSRPVTRESLKEGLAKLRA